MNKLDVLNPLFILDPDIILLGAKQAKKNQKPLTGHLEGQRALLLGWRNPGKQGWREKTMKK